MRPPQDGWQWNSFTFTLQVDCPHCGTMIAVNGPLRQATCNGCQKEVPLTPGIWSAQIAAATEGSRILNYPYKVISTEAREPRCPQCEKHFPFEPSWIGQEGHIPCPHCGAGVRTAPAPDWLQAELLLARQLVAAESEDGQPASSATAQPSHQAQKPIMLTCPNCSGALSVTAESERLLPCGYCGVEVFLPDPVWKRLHPVKTTQPWTVVYVHQGQDRLWTQEDYQEHQEEAALRRREAEQRARDEQTEQLEAILREQELEQQRKKGKVKSIVLVAVIVGGNLLLAAIIAMASRCNG